MRALPRTLLFLGIGTITLCLAGASFPAPSPDVLAWTKREVGAMFSFDMITMLTNVSDTQYFCIGVGGGGGWLPTPDFFDPEDLDLDNWVLAAASFGAKYAVLTAQHCSGFSLWPTDIFKSTGFNYTYSTTSSPFRGGGYDLVGAFVAACNKHGILPGIYYSLNQNYYLNVAGGMVLNTPLVPGQGNVSQALYGKIVLAQLGELWSKYGQLAEIWFDGDCTTVPGISQQIAELQVALQPHAIAFQGCSNQNSIRWVGTESGEPGYPLWSTAQDCAFGQGSPTGNVFCPAETDTVLAAFDTWFWRPGVPLRSLSDLQQVYYDSVGQNTNLLLNVAPNRTGTVDVEAADLYAQYGSWIAGCFSSQPLLQTSGEGTVFYVSSDTPVTFNHIVISEDQTHGEAVTEFFVSATLLDGITTVLSGQSIGNKLIRPVQAVTTTNVMLTITSSLSSPNITLFAVYSC